MAPNPIRARASFVDLQLDPIPWKRKQFWIRSRVNVMIKMDRIQKYPDTFGSDPVETEYKIQCQQEFLDLLKIKDYDEVLTYLTATLIVDSAIFYFNLNTTDRHLRGGSLPTIISGFQKCGNNPSFCMFSWL